MYKIFNESGNILIGITNLDESNIYLYKDNGDLLEGFPLKGNSIIECDKNYFRPLDVNTLLGDAKKARRILKWKPTENISSLIDEMIEAEYQNF